MSAAIETLRSFVRPMPKPQEVWRLDQAVLPGWYVRPRGADFERAADLWMVLLVDAASYVTWARLTAWAPRPADLLGVVGCAATGHY